MTATEEHSPDDPAPDTPWSSRLPVALLVVAVAALLRVALGYRPLPSIDDFAYLPPFRHLADPDLYPRDALLQSMSLHSLGWYAVYRLCDATVGLATGFWLATLALSAATVAGLARLLAAMRATPALLPLLALLACASELHGVGRGRLDGVFGSAMHGQWMALTALLFAYDAFLRDRIRRCGVFLGLSALCHLSVATHGGFVLGLAALVSTAPRWRNFVTIAGLSALVALPAIVPMLSHLSHSSAEAGWPVERIVREGYFFRLAHEYDFALTRTGWLGAALLMACGLAGALLLRATGSPARTGRALALALGQALLLAGAAIFYGPLAEASLVPYLLALTRTSPLLVVLAATLVSAGLGAHLQARGREEKPFQMVVAAALALATLLLLRMFVPWNAALVVLLALLPVAAVGLSGGRAARAGFVTVLVFVTLAAGLRIREDDRLEASPPPEAAELYAWVRSETPSGAVFVVPPGFQEFRWYAERSVYVDFKMFPPATVDAIAAWRHRLDDVASPDREARKTEGWDAARQFDRCYATRNSPVRIAALLQRSGADYFVWDSDGLRIPPLTGSDRTPAAGLGEVFRNSRYVVYRALEQGGGRDA